MSGRRHWVGVAAAAHVRAAVEGGFCQFSHGTERSVAKLSPGDRLAYYAPRETLEGDEPVQRFVAIGTVAGGEPQAVTRDGHTFHRRACAYVPNPTEAEVRPLLESLSFVRDPKHWGMAFRRGQFEVLPEDFEVIARAMRVWSKLP